MPIEARRADKSCNDALTVDHYGRLIEFGGVFYAARRIILATKSTGLAHFFQNLLGCFCRLLKSLK